MERITKDVYNIDCYGKGTPTKITTDKKWQDWVSMQYKIAKNANQSTLGDIQLGLIKLCEEIGLGSFLKNFPNHIIVKCCADLYVFIITYYDLIKGLNNEEEAGKLIYKFLEV